MRAENGEYRTGWHPRVCLWLALPCCCGWSSWPCSVCFCTPPSGWLCCWCSQWLPLGWSATLIWMTSYPSQNGETDLRDLACTPMAVFASIRMSSMTSSAHFFDTALHLFYPLQPWHLLWPQRGLEKPQPAGMFFCPLRVHTGPHRLQRSAALAPHKVGPVPKQGLAMERRQMRGKAISGAPGTGCLEVVDQHRNIQLKHLGRERLVPVFRHKNDL